MRRFCRCPVVFGAFRSKLGTANVTCGYEGEPQRALRPRPSRKPVLICPACLSEVK